MRTIYAHRQAGREIRLGLGIGAILSAGVLALELARGAGTGAWIAGTVLAILLASLALFGSLTVVVTDEELAFRFGPGLVRRRFPLAEIRAARVVRDPACFGWGIHWTPRGWLYNVGGHDALEIEPASGRALRIGSDEPEELLRALDLARGRLSSPAACDAPPREPRATG